MASALQLGRETAARRPGPLRRLRRPARAVAAPAAAESGCAAAAAGRAVRSSCGRFEDGLHIAGQLLRARPPRASACASAMARAGSRTRRSRYSPSIMCWRCAARSCSPAHLDAFRADARLEAQLQPAHVHRAADEGVAPAAPAAPAPRSAARSTARTAPAARQQPRTAPGTARQAGSRAPGRAARCIMANGLSASRARPEMAMAPIEAGNSSAQLTSTGRRGISGCRNRTMPMAAASAGCTQQRGSPKGLSISADGRGGLAARHWRRRRSA